MELLDLLLIIIIKNYHFRLNGMDSLLLLLLIMDQVVG
jgi:hypothetical protein